MTARAPARRAVVTGTLVARGALHVGAGQGWGGVDMALAADGRGRLYVSGTGLAGALRAWCERAWSDELVKQVWGFQDPAAVPERSAAYQAPPGHSSRVLVEDAPVDSGTEEVRDGVAIDRVTGTAADRLKFDRAVLAAGVRLRFEVSVELSDDSPAGPMVAHVVRALEQGKIRLGAARTRGLGRVVLEGRQVRVERLDSRDGLVAALRGRLAPDVAPAGSLEDLASCGAPVPEPVQEEFLEVTIAWRQRGPVMVRAAADGLGVDGLPLTTTTPAGVSPLITGSALKGLLRAHAERIVRTVRDLPVPSDREQQLDVPLVCWLFGVAPPGDAGHEEPAGDPLPGLGALSVDDCLGEPIDPAAWETVVSAVSPQAAHVALRDAGVERWEVSPHVAIDRWTGGAARGRLFSVLEPRQVSWSPVRIAVDLARLPRGERQAALALVCLVLDDLIAGRVPVGFAVNRGFGDIEVERVELSDGASSWTAKEGGFLSWLPERQRLKDAWTAWLEAAS